MHIKAIAHFPKEEVDEVEDGEEIEGEEAAVEDVDSLEDEKVLLSGAEDGAGVIDLTAAIEMIEYN